MPDIRMPYFGSRRRRQPTRRSFLQGSAAALVGAALASCSRGGLGDIQSQGQGGGSASSSNTLHIYAWAHYVAPETIEAFRAETGIEVVTDIYDSNETMLARMLAGGGDAYSIIYPSDYMVAEMVDMEMLVALDPERLAGMDALLDPWVSPVYDPDNAHSVPFSWGTTGLLYHRERLNPGPEDWSYLWDNQADLSRRITLLDDVRETMGAVLKSLGYSYNATDPSEIEAAYQRLLELRPDLASFQSMGWEDQLLAGDLDVVMSYSLDAIAVVMEDPELDYIIPTSGASLWTDTLVIPATAPNLDAAYEWINFTLRPEVAAATVERLFAATPNGSALELVDEDLLANQDIFPPDEVLARCEGIAPISEEALALYDRYWTEITSS